MQINISEYKYSIIFYVKNNNNNCINLKYFRENQKSHKIHFLETQVPMEKKWFIHENIIARNQFKKNVAHTMFESGLTNYNLKTKSIILL